MYSYSEKVVLGLLITVLFAAGLLFSIGNKTHPEVFSQEHNFFLIDINTASAEELKTIPYMSDSIAQEIIRYRLEKGRINSIDELLSVKGIGPAKMKRMKKYLKDTN